MRTILDGTFIVGMTSHTCIMGNAIRLHRALATINVHENVKHFVANVAHVES